MLFVSKPSFHFVMRSSVAVLGFNYENGWQQTNVPCGWPGIYLHLYCRIKYRYLDRLVV